MSHILWSLKTALTTRIFTENNCGGIEYIGKFTDTDATSVIAEHTSGMGIKEDIPITDPFFANTVYRMISPRALSCTRYAADQSNTSDAQTRQFFTALTPCMVAMDDGNWFGVGRMLTENEWWQWHTKLLKMILGEDILLAVIFLWACDFTEDADTPLARLCTQSALPPSGWLDALSLLVGNLLEGQTPATFMAFARSRCATVLNEGKPLTLPLVGCRNYDFVEEIQTIITKAKQRALIRSVSHGLSLAQIEGNIRGLVDLYDMKLVREAENTYDTNAICGMIADPVTGERKRAGYMRRTCAALFAPLFDAGMIVVTRTACIVGPQGLKWFGVFAELRKG